MIATKIRLFAFRVHFDLLKLKFSWLLYDLFYTKLYDLNVLYYRYRSECWYLPLKTALEGIGDENWNKFFKANFTPVKLT